MTAEIINLAEYKKKSAQPKEWDVVVEVEKESGRILASFYLPARIADQILDEEK